MLPRSFYNEELVQKSLEVAMVAHAGQKYGDRPYFDAHILKVWEALVNHHRSYMVQVAGILHDTIEDTSITFEELAEKFGEQIAGIVLFLSRDKEKETYFDYIRRIKENELCTQIKMEDVVCNLKASVLSEDASKIKRYTKALLILMGYD